MKLTKTRLKQLIKEELNKALKEFEYKYAPGWGKYYAQESIDKAINAVEEEYIKLGRKGDFRDFEAYYTDSYSDQDNLNDHYYNNWWLEQKKADSPKPGHKRTDKELQDQLQQQIKVDLEYYFKAMHSEV